MSAPRHTAVLSGDGKLLTRKQVAEKLGVCYDTVRKAVKAKRLRERRLPSAAGHRSIPRYALADVEAYIASGYSVGLK